MKTIINPSDKVVYQVIVESPEGNKRISEYKGTGYDLYMSKHQYRKNIWVSVKFVKFQ